MRTPLHGSRAPFRLASNLVYFDWRYVNHGGYRWLGPDREHVPMWTLDPVPPMHYQYRDMPLGIELVAKPAQRIEPVIQAEETDIILFGGSLIYDEGRYRLWYDCWPRRDIGSDRMGGHNLVRYAESDDGMDWKFPKLGLVEYERTCQNNVVNGGPLTTASGYHGGCVFKDPSASSGERYKAFCLGTISQQKLGEFRQTRPDDVDPFMADRDRVPALFGGVSPDGLHWTPLPEPLLVQTSDCHNICAYDTTLNKYVAYVRTWYIGRRTIGRTETDGFQRFPLPEEVFWPDAMQAPISGT